MLGSEFEGEQASAARARRRAFRKLYGLTWEQMLATLAPEISSEESVGPGHQSTRRHSTPSTPLKVQAAPLHARPKFLGGFFIVQNKHLVKPLCRRAHDRMGLGRVDSF